MLASPVPDGYINYPLRADLPPLPDQIKHLPIGPNGYPVPWFVAWIDGKPEFRAADSQKAIIAIKEKRCWVCGQRLKKEICFVIGPMCTINRVSAEPPSHPECGQFSVLACPFLNKPHMCRREGNMPEEAANPAGVMIERNPGVIALWNTDRYTIENRLFKIGFPSSVTWWREGRQATLEEVLESVRTGLPALHELAQQQGIEAERQLAKACKEAKKFYPKTPTLAG